MSTVSVFAMKDSPVRSVVKKPVPTTAATTAGVSTESASAASASRARTAPPKVVPVTATAKGGASKAGVCAGVASKGRTAACVRTDGPDRAVTQVSPLGSCRVY